MALCIPAHILPPCLKAGEKCHFLFRQQSPYSTRPLTEGLFFTLRPHGVNYA